MKRLAGRTGRSLVSLGVSLLALLALAMQQMRQVWKLVGLIALGMIAAVVLVGSVPLIALVNTTASTRAAFMNPLYDPSSSVQADIVLPDGNAIRQKIHQVEQDYQQHGSPFFHLPPTVSLQVPVGSGIDIHGYDMGQIASHVQLQQGRLPRAITTLPSTNEVEVAMTRGIADEFGLHVGSTLLILAQGVDAIHNAETTVPVTLKVVGVLANMSDAAFEEPFWHGDNLNRPPLPTQASPQPPPPAHILASNTTLLALFDRVFRANFDQPIQFAGSMHLSVYFPLDIHVVDTGNVGQLLEQLDYLSNTEPGLMSGGLDINNIIIDNSSLSIPAAQVEAQTTIVQVPVLALLGLMLGLILYFVAVMTELLVARQAEAIAITRSRGATGRQLFLTFVVQSLLLGLCTLVIGPVLIPLVVRFLTGAVFPTASQDALDVLPATPWETLLRLGWYVWVAVGMVVVTMCFSVWRTLRSSTLGRSTTQTIGVQRPLWQRLYADVLLALLGGLTYGLYTYLASTGIITAQLQIQLAGPCLLVAASLLCLAGALLFLRAFPWLVQAGARLAAKGTGIVPLFSFVVMARAPRQAMRTTLLLVFTIAFALFAQVFLATQQQRTVDLNNYVTAADFSGFVPQGAATRTFEQQLVPYQHLPGVQAATLAFVGDEYFLNAGGSSMQTVIATDPSSFGTAITWPQVDAQTNVSALLAHLADQRAAIARESAAYQLGKQETLSPLPAIVSAATKRVLHLSVGQTFFMTGVNYSGRMPLLDVGEVPYLPGVTDVAQDQGILVDYASFVPAYNVTITHGALLTPTNAWVHSKPDVASQAAVQHALSSGPLALGGLLVRSVLLAAMQQDPLSLNVVCVLLLGMVLVLLLAWIGCLSAAWLSVRARVRSLLALRALGATPGQLALSLAWEQGIIYTCALLLGVACGAGFTWFTLPSVIFTDTSLFTQFANAPTLDPFQAQVLLPLQIIMPVTVLIGLAVVILLCAVGIVVPAVLVARLSPAHMLRLSEDYVDEAPVAPKRQTIRAQAVQREAVRREARLRGLGRETQLGRALTSVRRSWSTLALLQLGVLLSVLFVCVVPLFSQIAATAGLHDALAQPGTHTTTVSSDPAQSIALGRVQAAFVEATNRLNRTMSGQVGAYFHEAPVVSLDNVNIVPGTLQVPAVPTPPKTVQFSGLSEQALPAQIEMKQGVVARDSASGPLQILLVPSAAAALHLHVGDRLTQAQGYPFEMQLVGLFQPRGGTESLLTKSFFYTLPSHDGIQNAAMALTTTEGLARALDRSRLAQTPGAYVLTGQATWRYALDQTITSRDLDDLVSRLASLRLVQTASRSNLFQFSTVDTPLGPLQYYQQSVLISSIPITCASALIIALVLLFLSFMVDLLVEREASTIAILRSRGASQRQVFAAFLTRMLFITGIGLLAGMALALPVVIVLTRLTLQPGDQQGLTYITTHPVQTVLGLAAFALASTAVTLGAVVFALSQATRTDYLTLRSESTRATRKALWQRWNLDVVGIAVALLAYGFSWYLSNAGIFDAAVQVQIKAPLVLTATICLALACMLLLLRLFPLLLRLGAMLALRNRGVEPMLALSHMARAPRQRLRTTLLLMVSTALVVFVVIFGASQNAHINDVAQYWAGTDFSGSLANQVDLSNVSQVARAYQHVKGVTSVTLGSMTELENSQGNKGAELLAVDLNSFANIVDWIGLSTAEKQVLVKKLSNPLSFPDLANTWLNAPGDAIPAVIDRNTADMLHMGVGGTFAFNTNKVGNINFFVIAEVENIPTVNDQSNGAGGVAGILVDYQAYNLLYQAQTLSTTEPLNIQDAPLNYIWLKTDGSAESIQHVRQVLQTGPLRLNTFYDREMMAQALVRNPLSLNLVGILILGTLAPLLLTWIGCLLASWLDVRQRQLLFSVLRALGSTPRQLARVLGWEQGLIFATAVVLGTLFGLLTAFLALPSLVLTSALPTLSTGNGSGFSVNVQDLFALQNTPMAHAVVPISLAIVVALLALLALLAMLLMTRSASRLALGQTLRLNED